MTTDKAESLLGMKRLMLLWAASRTPADLVQTVSEPAMRTPTV